jgi:hypothetical protein
MAQSKSLDVNGKCVSVRYDDPQSRCFTHIDVQRPAPRGVGPGPASLCQASARDHRSGRVVHHSKIGQRMSALGQKQTSQRIG